MNIPPETVQSSLVDAIQQAISKEVERIVVEEADAAAKRVNERVREEAGGIAAKVIGWSQFSMNRYDIQMTIKLPPVNKRDDT